MLTIEAQIVIAHAVWHILQNPLLDAHAEQLARGFAGRAATEAVLGLIRVADEVSDAANRAPGPVPINIIEELDEARLLWLDRRHRIRILRAWCVGPLVAGSARRHRARRHAAASIAHHAIEADLDELLRRADQVAAHCAGYAADNHSFVQAVLQACADAREVAVAAHQHIGRDIRTIKYRLDDVHEHVEVNSALRDDCRRLLWLWLWRIVRLLIAILFVRAAALGYRLLI